MSVELFYRSCFMSAGIGRNARQRGGTVRASGFSFSHIDNVAQANNAFENGAIKRLGKPEATAIATRPANQRATALFATWQNQVKFASGLEYGIADIAGTLLRYINEIDRQRTIAQDEDGFGIDG